jgi:hypothetical protein
MADLRQRDINSRRQVSACSAVIDAKVESGHRLAPAYCHRGHGLTEKRELDGALRASLQQLGATK